MNSKRYILLLIVSYFSITLKAQLYKPISFPAKVDKKYIFDPVNDQKKYYEKIKKSLPSKAAKELSYKATFGKSAMFSDGDVYLSWGAMEAYINQILDSIMPSNLISKKINAYIGRDPSMNAFCLYDGTMIVNVGLIAEVKSEAALANIMGHELGHFIKNHIVNALKKQAKKGGNSKDLKAKIDNQKYSQENELEADIQGFSIAKNANYDVEEALSNYEVFIRQEEYINKRNKGDLVNADTVKVKTKVGTYAANTLEKLLSTHPDMKDRKEKLKEFLKANPQAKKQKYKIDEDLFTALQKQARLECLNLMFDNTQYEECLERAFLFYLYQPSDLDFTYFIAECTRRLCLMNYRLKPKGFLAERLTNNGFKEGEGILRDLKYIVPNADNYKKISATELLTASNPAFNTYKEAFYYFTQKLIDKGYQEAFLMRALFENNKTKINENINKYVASPKAEHKEYALNYQNNNLAEYINKYNNEIVMLPAVRFGLTAYTNGIINPNVSTSESIYYDKTEIVGKQMANEICAAINESNTSLKAISLPQASTENFNTKYNYTKNLSLTILARRDENEGYEVVHYYKELENEDYTGKLDIFRLDPDVWEFFRKNEINTLTMAEFIRNKDKALVGLRTLRIIYGVFLWPYLPFAIASPVNYKRLNVYSYNPKLGALYYDYKIKKRKLRIHKAVNMFKGAKKEREDFIREYNLKY